MSRGNALLVLVCVLGAAAAAIAQAYDMPRLLLLIGLINGAYIGWSADKQ